MNGDGRAVYKGDYNVDVVGEHTYRVPPGRVATLVEKMRANDIWSLREKYWAPITDSATFRLTLRLGEHVHRIEDCAGRGVGMPRSVSDLEDAIDEVSEATGFVNLSRRAVERLEAQGFNFQSQAGSDLLARAVSNRDSHDNDAMLRLVELGAPVVGAKTPDESFLGESRPLLEEALVGQRIELIDPLIQRGTLQTNGAPDQQKIDRAFHAAIIGGRLGPIEKLWTITGTKPHPPLTFEDVSERDPSIRKTVPVTLLLRRPILQEHVWEGLAVTKWLAALGCDIQAAGAARSGHGSLENERLGGIFRSSAKYKGWTRVIAWLDAHRN